MKESFELKAEFPVKPHIIYSAWLNSDEHSKMTGGEAHCSDRTGDSFTVWDGYISGKNLSLNENREIVQSWRTAEFSERDEDSHLVIQFSETENGTEILLIHSNIPEGQTQYKQGWEDHYFIPMKQYFH